jgi:hypothetical protein
MSKKLNVLNYKDDVRIITIQYTDGEFFVLNQDTETLDQNLTSYSLEAFVRTFTAMNTFFQQLALTDKEVALKLFKMKNINSKTTIDYV